MTTATLPTAADYERAFVTEAANEYPIIDAFEREMGYAVDRVRLEAAARVLACPVKVNPPSWQHGRVLYAMARRHFSYAPGGPMSVLDIGTAKGFSALCLQWALDDSGAHGAVVSVDVIDPAARQRRNTVAETDGPLTLAETLGPWPEASRITFVKSPGVAWLEKFHGRIDFAFVDGKHTGTAVFREGELLASKQQAGDVAVFDDVQIDGIAMAVKSLGMFYDVRYLAPKPERRYAIGVRR